jgi:exodeoxyribonuclease VII large subunit
LAQLGFTFDRPPERRIFSVAELTAVVRGLLEDVFGDCWVSGEISNCRRAPSGHYYFTLKDADAQLKCVCFRQNAMYLKVKPQDGLEIVARGRLSVYEARGEYQLYVEAIEPRGYGALQLAFEQLKKKLDAEGLFDQDRKRELPRLPRRIGIVTSPQGAVIADMVRVLERRCPGLHIRLYPVQVQGEPAAADIARAVRWFSDSGWPDVVIVGRGGGSLEDLWAFNEEIVARAIAESAMPVVSAVGHQTDFTIADFVADLRAPTPSAAAELVAPSKAELFAGVRGMGERLTQAIRYRIARSARRLVESGVERPAAIVRRRIQRLWQRNDELELRMREKIVGRIRAAEKRLRASQHALAELDLRVRLARRRAKLEKLDEALAPALRLRIERAGSRLDGLDRALASLSPIAILERGYAIVSDAERRIIRDASSTQPGRMLQVRLYRGRLGVQVETVTAEE